MALGASRRFPTKYRWPGPAEESQPFHDPSNSRVSPFGGFETTFLVRAIAEWLVLGGAATAQGDGRF